MEEISKLLEKINQSKQKIINEIIIFAQNNESKAKDLVFLIQKHFFSSSVGKRSVYFELIDNIIIHCGMQWVKSFSQVIFSFFEILVHSSDREEKSYAKKIFTSWIGIFDDSVINRIELLFDNSETFDSESYSLEPYVSINKDLFQKTFLETGTSSSENQLLPEYRQAVHPLHYTTIDQILVKSLIRIGNENPENLKRFLGKLHPREILNIDKIVKVNNTLNSSDSSDISKDLLINASSYTNPEFNNLSSKKSEINTSSDSNFSNNFTAYKCRKWFFTEENWIHT